eukprot:1162581_1
MKESKLHHLCGILSLDVHDFIIYTAHTKTHQWHHIMARISHLSIQASFHVHKSMQGAWNSIARDLVRSYEQQPMEWYNCNVYKNIQRWSSRGTTQRRATKGRHKEENHLTKAAEPVSEPPIGPVKEEPKEEEKPEDEATNELPKRRGTKAGRSNRTSLRTCTKNDAYE